MNKLLFLAALVMLTTGCMMGVKKDVAYEAYGAGAAAPANGYAVAHFQQTTESFSLQVAAYPEHNTEEYDYLEENIFKNVVDNPLSTFSIDVDGASFSNVRRHLRDNNKPPKGSVRAEEFINYFDYNYPKPEGDEAFSVVTEIGECPWNKNSRLVHVGLKGKDVDIKGEKPSNIVFLLDVSGSMNTPNGLPLLKKSLKLLLRNMNPTDRVAIVVYAGAAGVVLPSTEVSNIITIEAALESLRAGGSTAGAQGIELAYKIAKENFILNGNNRVILATDGDFNVGVSSEAGLVELIEKKRDENIFLSVLGFGRGNYADARMEQLSNKGNGNYAYIDNLLEAKKVLVQEMSGTLYTIAKDVKIQVEFNPLQVASYRLIGYENRALENQDFDNDKKDAGELGANHTVTAIYEVVLANDAEGSNNTGTNLAYQKSTPTDKAHSDELMTVKLRYKEPEGTKSKLITKILTTDQKGGANLKWASSMAAFAMILNNSNYIGDFTMDKLLALAKENKGADEKGYRAEAIRMIEQAQILYQ